MVSAIYALRLTLLRLRYEEKLNKLIENYDSSPTFMREFMDTAWEYVLKSQRLSKKIKK